MASHRDAVYAQQRFLPPYENGAATPPPISTTRRLIIDETVDETTNGDTNGYGADDRNGEALPSPITGLDGLAEEEPVPPTQPLPEHPARQLHAQLSQRAAVRPAPGLREQRTPLLEHQRLYRDVDFEPRLRNGDRSPLRRIDYRSIEEEMQHDHGLQNGDSAPYHMADGRPIPNGRSHFSEDSMSISRQSITSTSSTRMPDFFGPGIFQVVLHNPTTSHQLLKFSATRFCSENVEFLAKVEQYHNILNDLTKTMTTIHKDFISPEAPNQINLPDAVMRTVHIGMKTIVKSTLPAMESLFSEVQEKIEQLVFTDIYPRFVRYQMTMSATRALAMDRFRYQGLGDCFCLTDPNKADNPIVSASEGFVKVTGYTRPEIIPRNCRFLQGQHTDRTPVRRLKKCIDERKESVELLLNYKKNGEPFWNLLYVAPLYNAKGKLAFFIGGQINCSTTIHSNTDVMRILSTSSDIEDAGAKQPPPINRTTSGPFSKKSFLRAFGVRGDDTKGIPVGADTGMEQDLINRIEGKDIGVQMKEFYTAYSKYIVLKYDSFIVNFCSEGVTDMLNPANNAEGTIVGMEIFRFFKQNMVSNNTEYKTRVRNGLRGGYSVSAEVHLQTKRSALFRGDEKFITHWTPLKDENAVVHWVVVSLAPTLT